jgi:multidrug efflux system membrane fusion protein
MVVINQLSPIYVTFSVPGRFLSDIRRFQARRPLVVRATPGSGTPATDGGSTPGAGSDDPAEVGSISFIDNAVDPTTSTIKLKATFPNAAHTLWPGLFVQVGLELTTEASAVVVPAAAVQASQTGQYVYVVKPDRTVEMRTVTVQRQQGNEMVIAQGLSAGEEVVTDGHLRLTPGARVTDAGGRGERDSGKSDDGGKKNDGRGRRGEGRRGEGSPKS